MKKTSVLQNGLIWFGAGVSIAEILTGTYFAPLGFGKGLAAILLGHLIGCTLLYLAGLIGGKTGLSAMIAAKQLACPLAGDLLGHVHSVASAVIPVSGIALRIFVGQAGAHESFGRSGFYSNSNEGSDHMAGTLVFLH